MSVYFDVHVHHGGRFQKRKRGTTYVGGVTSSCVRYDEDRLSYFEIVSFWKDFGYSVPCKMVGLNPMGDLENGLLSLTDDADITYFLNQHKAAKSYSIHIYVITIEESQVGGDREVDGDWQIERGEATEREDEELSERWQEFLNFELEDPEEDDIFGGNRNKENEGSYDEVREDATVVIHDVQTEEQGGNVDAVRIIHNDEDIDLTEFNKKPLTINDRTSPLISDDENDVNYGKWPQFNDEVDIMNPTLEEGLEFKNAASFRLALQEYAVLNSIDYKWALNEGHKMSAKCKNECGWRIYASKNSQTQNIQIKTFHPTCTCGSTFDNAHVTSTYLARRFKEEFANNPEWAVRNVQTAIRKKISVYITPSQAYRAKRKAKGALEGIEALQYQKLWDYGEMIKTTNPSSCVKIMCDVSMDGDPLRFERLYLRYNAQKVGFLAGCRPIICLDACHLKRMYGGQLMAAVARDGNDILFPVAIAIVEQETIETWTWFMEIFAEDIGAPDELGLTIISDRQKGILDVMKERFPSVEHRYCMRHLYANFKLKHKGRELGDALWECAYASTPEIFKTKMEKLRSMSDDAWKDMMKVNPAAWSISYFNTRSKCSSLTNNLSESFNACIGPARDKRIISLLEWIRVKFMKRWHVKYTGMQKHQGFYCPNAITELENIKKSSRNCFALASGRLMYEVESVDGNHVVNLPTKECSCRLWQVIGIPCKHAVAAIQQNKEQPEKYLHHCYSKDAYLAAYSEIIKPMPSEALWKRTGKEPVLPPYVLRPPSRPKTKRKRAADEPPNPHKNFRRNTPIHCGKCGNEGHNSRSCKSSVTGETPWQSRVRMQKKKAAQKVSQRVAANGAKLAARKCVEHGPKKAMQQASRSQPQCAPQNLPQQATKNVGRLSNTTTNSAPPQVNVTAPSPTIAPWFSERSHSSTSNQSTVIARGRGGGLIKMPSRRGRGRGIRGSIPTICSQSSVNM